MRVDGKGPSESSDYGVRLNTDQINLPCGIKAFPRASKGDFFRREPVGENACPNRNLPGNCGHTRPAHMIIFCRKVYSSAVSSMILSTGLPPPCPALVSIRMRTGESTAWACCKAAAYL